MKVLEKINGRSQGKMLKDVLNELTQKYSLGSDKIRCNFVRLYKACYMPLLYYALQQTYTHYFCFSEVLGDHLQQPKTPKYFLEFMFAIAPSKMVRKWAKINVILFH